MMEGHYIRHMIQYQLISNSFKHIFCFSLDIFLYTQKEHSKIYGSKWCEYIMDRFNYQFHISCNENKIDANKKIKLPQM